MFRFLKRKAPVSHVEIPSGVVYAENDGHTILVTEAAQDALNKHTRPIKRTHASAKQAAERKKLVRSMAAHKNPVTGKRWTVPEIVKETGLAQKTVWRYTQRVTDGKR